MQWIMAHLELLISVLAVSVALLYLWYKGELLTFVAQVWGIILVEVGDLIASIPDSFFTEVAEIIHDDLPVMVKPFFSVEWIARQLLQLRQRLLDSLPDRPASNIATVKQFQDIRYALLTEIAEL